MSDDVKMFNACNHIVDGKQYHLSICPRCNGDGYYYDIHYNPQGETIIANGEIKMQQEILKVMLDNKFTNPFHPHWGALIKRLIGKKNLPSNKAQLEMYVRQAVNHLQNVQHQEQRNNYTISNSEMIESVEYVDVTPLVPTGYLVEVYIKNKVGNIYNQVIKF